MSKRIYPPELHTFVAVELGIPRRAFQGDHYDVPDELYEVAVAAGAEPVGGRELLARLMGAGLRLKKTQGVRAAGVVPATQEGRGAAAG